MQIVLTRVWAEALETFPELQKKLPDVMDKALLQEAHELRKRMVQQFREQRPLGGSWAPLSPLTIRARRVQGFKGSKILIRTADMRNSIQPEKIGRGLVYVGVNRTALGRAAKGGKQRTLVNIGKIHEFGATFTITVTRKMQRFLFGVLLKAASGRDIHGRFLKKGQKSGGGGGGGGSGRFKLGAKITIRIPARPFIRPAVEAKTQAEYEQSIANRVAVLLKGKLGKP